MKSNKFILLGITMVTLFIVKSEPIQMDDWGFYAHKLINRMAVFTLPGDLIEFYKANLDYITNHAVDPDKRRYALKGEAIRHYIDLDHWKKDSVSSMPKDFAMAIIKFDRFYLIHDGKKMLLFDTISSTRKNEDSLFYSEELFLNKMVSSYGIALKDLKRIITKAAMPFYDTEEWKIPADAFKEILPFAENDDFIVVDDRLSPHGILPYHLEKTYYQLIDAFKSKSKTRILRLSADIGHYVGDAHVPLHTSQNYNGQLTNQEGIHAFWESRIPELFAEAEFDFVVGPATYIPNIKSFIWDIIEESHQGVALVLDAEKSLSQQTAPDQQYCYDERLGVITKIQCKEYSKKYNQLLDNQVEDRMRSSILDLGSIWMSAWIEAGQPDLKFEDEKVPIDEVMKLDSSFLKSERFQIRDHE